MWLISLVLNIKHYFIIKYEFTVLVRQKYINVLKLLFQYTL